MAKKLSILKSQFEDEYTEMTYTIKSSDFFFENFDKNPERIENMKKMLDSDIALVNKRLAELIA